MIGDDVSDRVLVYQIEIPIRWGDMDAMGHVNNTVYFRYMEQARISWMEALGWQGGGEGMLVVNAHCTFVRQLEYPGTVLVRQYRGVEYRVTVLKEGYEYQGGKYKSLSKIAALITGAAWSGPAFFGLKQAKEARH